MPVKNAARYLEECLDSIRCQTYDQWELIAVNDHSSDNSYDILSKYSAHDQRIKVFNNTASGIIPALQLAYNHSSGTYITRMDADDIMSTDKLSLLYKLLLKNGLGHIATGKVKYFSAQPLGEGYKNYESWLNALCQKNSHFSEIYKECVIPSPCWMVHRSDFDLCGGFDQEIYPEDYDLCFRFYQQKLLVVSSSSILHYWRDYPVRSSRTDENYKDNRFLSLKTGYFITLDYNNNTELHLWGAGKKAKKIAQILIEKKIKFHWLSNNQKKIGRDIYGVIIKPQSALSEGSQVIIAIANIQEKKEIKSILEEYKLVDAYYFS